MSTDADYAYCAALYEGEGYLTIRERERVNGPDRKAGNRSSGTYALLGIHMCDVGPLLFFQRHLGGSLYGPEERPNRKPIYRLVILKWAAVQNAYEKMRPWMQAERRIARFEEAMVRVPASRARSTEIRRQAARAHWAGRPRSGELPCADVGCERPLFRHGRCATHYRSWYRYGGPNHTSGR
jgi:hypothetical protein